MTPPPLTQLKSQRPSRLNNNLEFLLARVDQARAEAEAATLSHVRERCQRSEAAWQSLADKAVRTEQRRESEAQRKIEQGLTS